MADGTLKCPACNSRLMIAPEPGGFKIWCGAGDCTSDAANRDYHGGTIKEALEQMIDAVDREMTAAKPERSTNETD